jgi:hypothetical protein
LHGKGGDGAATSLRDGVATVAPRGNADGWGGRQWIYFPDSRYDAARSVVRAAIDAQGCAQVVVHGFSNGGAFAAKLACRGETFDGRVVGYVIDDPVVDHGVEPCAASPAGVARTLYWTGALAATAKPGWNCAEQDWTCDGGTTIGIDAYARALGVPAKPSRFRDHQPYDDAPELAAWRS